MNHKTTNYIKKGLFFFVLCVIMELFALHKEETRDAKNRNVNKRDDQLLFWRS